MAVLRLFAPQTYFFVKPEPCPPTEICGRRFLYICRLFSGTESYGKILMRLTNALQYNMLRQNIDTKGRYDIVKAHYESVVILFWR